MFIKIYDEIPEEAKTIREAVFIKEQGFKDEFDEIDDVSKKAITLTRTTTAMTYLKVNSRDFQNCASRITAAKLESPTKFFTLETPFQSVKVR